MLDLVLYNANVMTMDPLTPSARWVGIRDGAVFSLGSHGDIDDLKKKSTRSIDCTGKTVLPGFIDAHGHLFALAEGFVVLRLGPRDGIRSISDIQAAIEQSALKLPPGTWIKGQGYDEFYLEEKRHPTCQDLDAASSHHPVKITHRSGRAHVLNSLALRIAGISKESGDPPEGLIDRKRETGEPTGLLFGMGDHLAKVIPPIERAEMELGIERASRALTSLGITSIHDASRRNNRKRWEILQDFKKRGLLKPRVTLILGQEGFEEQLERPFPPATEDMKLRLGGVKIILHRTTGELLPTERELSSLVFRIHQAGRQAVIHAIEQEEIKAACKAVESALCALPRPDARHRVEHCSLCTPSLAKRIASLGMIVVTQPAFVYYHGERYLKTVPEPQWKHLYPLATLMRNGVLVAASSDCPVIPPDPIKGIYAAMTRRAENGEPFPPGERISLFEALQMYTAWAARAAFEETFKGSIAPGKAADLIVLSHDPTRLRPEQVGALEVEMTILGGEVVWEKGGLSGWDLKEANR